MLASRRARQQRHDREARRHTLQPICILLLRPMPLQNRNCARTCVVSPPSAASKRSSSSPTFCSFQTLGHSESAVQGHGLEWQALQIASLAAAPYLHQAGILIFNDIHLLLQRISVLLPGWETTVANWRLQRRRRSSRSGPQQSRRVARPRTSRSKPISLRSSAKLCGGRLSIPRRLEPAPSGVRGSLESSYCRHCGCKRGGTCHSHVSVEMPTSWRAHAGPPSHRRLSPPASI